MQKIKSIAFALVIGTAAIGLWAPPASATVILNVDASGQLTGAQNVDVGGTLFDVTFADGTCIALFTGCNDPADFTFNTLASALSAAQALLDQVFVDTVSYLFDSQPSLTRGCDLSTLCRADIPYFVFPTDRVQVGYANNFPPPTLDTTDFAPAFYTTDDLHSHLRDTYAVFASLASAGIPEPGTLLLFVGGLAFMAAFGRRRRRQA